MNLANILSLTSPIYLLIGLGYLVASKKFVTREQVRVLAWFIMYIGLPAAMFKALSTTDIQTLLNPPLFFAFALGSLFPFAVTFVLAKFRNKNLTEAAIFALGTSLSNSLMIGFPIMLQLFGEPALVPFAIILLVENLIILPLALALADTGSQEEKHFFQALVKALPALFKNPIIVSILAGFFFSLLAIPLPTFAMRAVDMMAATVGGLALFTIGGLLYGLNPKGLWADIAQIGLSKLILHPAGVVLALLLFPALPEMYQHILIIAAAVPMFTVLAMFGARYGLEAVATAVLLPTVVCSFFTINLLIWLLDIS